MLAPALLLALSAAASAADKAPAAIPGVGVLLLGEGGDQDWRAQLDAVKKRLGRTPVEFAGGAADARAIQQSVSRLEASPGKIKKIVAVPLYVSSFSDVLDEDRYILGIREKPSAAIVGGAHSHFGSPHRVKTKLPIVLTRALDDHDLFVQLLAERALKQTKEPAKDALLLIGLASASTDSTKEWLDSVAALAEKVRQKGGFAASRAAAISEGYGPERRDQSRKDLRKLVLDLRKQGRVVALSLELTARAGHSRVAPALDGLFVKLDQRALFPDPKIADWVYAQVVDGDKLPDMRNFKDDAAPGSRHRANFPPLGGY